MAVLFILGCFVASVASALLSVWYSAQQSLQALQTTGRSPNDILLTKSPTRLTSFELIAMTISILTKYLTLLTGQVSPLRPDPSRDQAFTLPSIRVHGLIDVSNDDFNKFTDAVTLGSSSSQDKSTISPLFLVATTGPLLPYILSLPTCPIKPLGSVNTRNTFKIQDPAFCRDARAIQHAAQARELSYVATFGGPTHPGRRQKRGVECAITIDVLRSGKVVLSQDVFFLQFLPSSTLPRFKPPPASTTAASQADHVSASPSGTPPQTSEQTFALAIRDPHRWAACCKDYNPIHVSVAMAKLFGFRSVIAHGNHAVAVALQRTGDAPAAGTGEPRAVAAQLVWTSASPVTVEMKFVKPMVLPVKGQITWQADAVESSDPVAAKVNFSLSKGQTQYTVGSCFPTPTGEQATVIV